MPDHPHHIIQRGNRKQKVFFNDNDKIAYLDYLRLYAKPAGIDIWAYCLMDNHVHLIVVPKREKSLAVGLGNAHVRYTRRINFREGWRGYLWEGRFKSYVMSEKHLYAAIRYVERNPVRAGIVKKAEKYNWSSAKAHVNKTKDSILSDNFLISEIKNWTSYLAEEDREEDKNIFIKHFRTGRPLGDDKYLEELERITGRNMKKKTPGPKKRAN
ncbi:MAG: transposase [Candidatus Omnitrophota bacterium]|nr:transposase [Candidatus Omnitrophota bacterium]